MIYFLVKIRILQNKLSHVSNKMTSLSSDEKKPRVSYASKTWICLVVDDTMTMVKMHREGIKHDRLYHEAYNAWVKKICSIKYGNINWKIFHPLQPYDYWVKCVNDLHVDLSERHCISCPSAQTMEQDLDELTPLKYKMVDAKKVSDSWYKNLINSRNDVESSIARNIASFL